MSQSALHQFVTGATSGDAITDQALLVRDWLREMGFVSEVYALHIHPSMAGEARPLHAYRRVRGETWAIYRHSIGSEVPDFLRQQGLRLLLIYHNVTPPEFFERTDPLRAHLARLGQQQLHDLQPHVGLALADSPFNARDLAAAGYGETAVLPITLDTERYDLPLNTALAERLEATRPNLLFISRLAPNKCQEDLVKLLYFLHRVRADAHLYLVGDRWEIGYDRWVMQLAGELGVADSVTLTDKVSQQDMVTYLKRADLYVSMSAHEGFGVPLIESMYLGVPVMAYGGTAVPDTMGRAGVLFYQKDFEQLAELCDLLLTDDALRQRLIACQRERVEAFLAPQVRRQFENHLRRLGLR